MAAIDRKTRDEITNLEGVHDLVQTYEEIAAIRMQRVKTSVLNNRDFLSDLFDIYRQVRFSYQKKLEEEGRDGDDSGFAVIGNGRPVFVLLSANTGLYGDIIHKTFDLFVKGLESRPVDADVVVVGRVGQRLFEAVRTNLGISSYKYFDLPDSSSDASDFVDIVSYIAEYEKAVVFHGQFESILVQKPVKEELSGELSEAEAPAGEAANYIFEPSLERVVGFFESEILASIFEQSLYESSLGKYAARMINLDRAVVNIERILEQANQGAQKARHNDDNKKQLGTLASMSLWGK